MVMVVVRFQTGQTTTTDNRERLMKDLYVCPAYSRDMMYAGFTSSNPLPRACDLVTALTGAVAVILCYKRCAEARHYRERGAQERRSFHGRGAYRSTNTI